MNTIIRNFVFYFFMFVSWTTNGQEAYLKLYNLPISLAENPIGCFLQPDSSLITAITLSSHLILVKTDSDGNLIWAKIDSSNRAENRFDCIGITRSRDGNFLAYGRRLVPGSSYSNTSVLKIDTAGNIMWNKTYINIFDPGFYLDTTRDQGFLLSATTHDTSLAFPPTYKTVIKADSMGNVNWCRYYDSDSLEYNYSMVETANGNLLYFTLNSVIKVDSSGLIISANWKYNQPYALLKKIHQVNPDFFLERAENGYIAAYDSSGKSKWRMFTDAKDIASLSDSTFASLSYEQNIWPGIAIMKFDTSGTILHHTFFRFDYQIFPNTFQVCSNGRYYITGSIDQYQTQYYSLFLLKTLENGYSGCGEDTTLWQTTLIHDSIAPYVVNSFPLNCSILIDTIVSNPIPNQSGIPLCYQITSSNEIKFDNSTIEIFPNPTNNDLTLTSENPLKEIDIYSLLGDHVTHQNILNGSASTTIDLSKLLKGTYSIRIETEEGTGIYLFVKQ